MVHSITLTSLSLLLPHTLYLLCLKEPSGVPQNVPASTGSVWNESEDDITEEHIEAEWNRLEDRLQALRLTQIEMDDDGNCMLLPLFFFLCLVYPAIIN